MELYTRASNSSFFSHHLHREKCKDSPLICMVISLFRNYVHVPEYILPDILKHKM